jgi:very-short-patch-repair endonuclease
VQGQTNKDIRGHQLQRSLRSSMTDAERKLWGALRLRQFEGYKFRRQHPYDRFILDFVCIEKRIVIEVDGGQHTENRLLDGERTAFLEKAGFRVLRSWNHEVLTQHDAVKASIWQELQSNSTPSPPHPSP